MRLQHRFSKPARRVPKSALVGRASIGLLAAWLLFLSALPATAQPWAEPGEAQLRRDIELLAAHRLIDGPVNQWPLPFKQISRSLNERVDRAYPAYVERAIARVRAALPDERRAGIGIAAELSGTNEPRLVRGFAGGARQEADLGVSADALFSRTYLKLSVGWRDDQPGGDVHFDDSYFAQGLFGNWVLYGGTLDQWWGPGWDSALILSNNARPFPRIGFQRLDPRPFDTKWLSWLGNWNVNFTLGRLDDDRSDFDNPLLALIRVQIQPVEGLDIGFSRALMLCGEDPRPCDFETWTSALIGVGDLDNTGTLDEAGNQLAGIDIRWTNTLASRPYSLYVEAVGEDENQPLIDKFSILVGGTLAGYWEARSLGWQLRVEASDTEADNFFGLEVDAGTATGVTYNHFIYTDGYEFLDRTIGHSLDTDSRLVTAALNLWDPAEREYWLRYRWAKVNATTSRAHEVSAGREIVNIVEAGIRSPLPIGEGILEVRLRDNAPDTPGENDFEGAVEAKWTIAF